ncbi:MAG: type II toxin-antitoxin system RelE/ParE family toxin [Elusimicrobia bacterium]|nr:type II toxin-antitoxin system RelE/ParE family toxin [Candidatus Liberimonas magnetica]
MAYTILFDERVLSHDLCKLNKDIQQRIMAAIKNRLTIAPEQYGEPLRKTLKPYWKLCIGDYRVVFKILKNEILILAIMHRKMVYLAALSRISHLG